MVTFTPTRSGIYRIDATLASLYPLPSQPFSLRVRPGVLCASKSIATGSGLTLATAGLQSAFTVTVDLPAHPMSTQSPDFLNDHAWCRQGTSTAMMSRLSAEQSCISCSTILLLALVPSRTLLQAVRWEVQGSLESTLSPTCLCEGITRATHTSFRSVELIFLDQGTRRTPSLSLLACQLGSLLPRSTGAS